MCKHTCSSTCTHTGIDGHVRMLNLSNIKTEKELSFIRYWLIQQLVVIIPKVVIGPKAIGWNVILLQNFLHHQRFPRQHKFLVEDPRGGKLSCDRDSSNWILMAPEGFQMSLKLCWAFKKYGCKDCRHRQNTAPHYCNLEFIFNVNWWI